MKKKLSKQDRLIEEIMNDIKNVPSFIDGKTGLPVFRILQTMLYSFIKLTKPVFLTDYQIALIDEEVIDSSIQLTLVADESLHSMVVVYLNKRLMYYYDLAMEEELYEATANIKRFFERV